MNKKELAEAFNVWMDRYTNHPEQFEQGFQSVIEYLREKSEGIEPTYGETCAEYVLDIIHQLRQQPASA